MEKFIISMDLGSLVADVNFNDREDDIRFVNEELEKEGFVFKENWSGQRNNLDWWLEVDLKEFHKVISILGLLGKIEILSNHEFFGFHLEFIKNNEN